MSFLEPVSPIATQRRKYKPQIGHTLTVDLPGERVRARIEKVITEDAVVCVILSTPMAKTQHRFVKDEMICVERRDNNIGLECWLALDERQLEEQARVARFEEAERVKAADAERARVAALHKADLAEQTQPAPPPSVKAVVKRKPRKRVLVRKPVRRKTARTV